MCHGANGNGKGDVVGDLKLTLKDYTDPAALKDMTDGEIFYIIKNGKGQMPAEGERLKPDDIWNMVLLVRSFSKKPIEALACIYESMFGARSSAEVVGRSGSR